jgi:hypothetical protein
LESSSYLQKLHIFPTTNVIDNGIKRMIHETVSPDGVVVKNLHHLSHNVGVSE